MLIYLFLWGEGTLRVDSYPNTIYSHKVDKVCFHWAPRDSRGRGDGNSEACITDVWPHIRAERWLMALLPSAWTQELQFSLFVPSLQAKILL